MSDRIIDECPTCFGMMAHAEDGVCPRAARFERDDEREKRVEPTPAQLDRIDDKLDHGGGPKPGKPVPDWAFAFQVGTQLNINGFVCRVAGHYVDDVSEEAIGFVLIPEERTAKFLKREREKERNAQIDKRRKAMKGVKGGKGDGTSAA